MRLHKENLANNRKVVLLHRLYNVTNQIILTKLVRIANIFGSCYFIKIDSIDNQTMQNIQCYLSDPLIIQKYNTFNVKAYITTHELFNLLTKIDFDKTMVELYVYDKNAELLCSTNNETYNFYMCISDNDGPFIIFNKLIYDQEKVIAKIKEII